jgi:hypothetical protein
VEPKQHLLPPACERAFCRPRVRYPLEKSQATEMNRDEKTAVIEEISEKIKASEAISAIDYRGISVAQAAKAITSFNKVATITEAQVRQIAERKMPDLNANDLDAASKIIAGTARSMGVEVR